MFGERKPAPASAPAPRGGGAGRGPWRVLTRVSGCLGWRLVILMSACLIVLLGASGWFALQLHERHLVSLLRQNALGLGETILFGTEASMLANDQDRLARTIDDIGRREQVRAIRLLDARGTIQYSDRREEIGARSDPSAPQCAGCHRGASPRAPATLAEGLQLYSLPGGEEALGLGVPVLNAPRCWSAPCHVHPPGQKVLGMLDVELSTAGLEAAMADARRQMTLLSLLTVVIVCSALGFVTWRVVHRPLHDILAGIRRLGSGDLAHRLQHIPVGELGEVTASINEMSARLERAQQELETWARTLEQRVQEKSQELERTRDQMVFTEKMASLGKLAAVVAHEINNPLAGILVYAKLLRRNLPHLDSTPGNGRAEMDEKLATIERETARCGDIVRNLLSFSRRDEPRTASTSLNAILENSVKLLRHQTELQGVTVSVALDPALPDLVCDPGLIQQAALALLMNAIEAMPEGGTLTVRSRPLDDKRVRIEVQDTGVGIPEEFRDRIFEPFFSTKHDQKGTGLGLSVLYGIVQRHQGAVSFDSEPGQGTVFRVDLPLSPLPLASPNAEPAALVKGRTES